MADADEHAEKKTMMWSKRLEKCAITDLYLCDIVDILFEFDKY